MSTTTVTDASDLAAKLRNAAPGDTILLSGKFGAVELAGIRPERQVTIAAAAPGAAHFERLIIQNCANLSISGLYFWPFSPVQRSQKKLYLMTSYPNSANIEVVQCVFRGRADSDDHAKWTLDDWNAAKIGGALLRGPNSVVRNSAAIGVQFGFGVSAPHSELFGNRVFGFSGDGLRATDDNCVVIGNRITDAMQIDENHSDGFQSFKVKGLLNGLVVKDNAFLEWTVRRDNPLRAKMQGISFHNGPYSNIVIRDNAVSATSPNGIHVNGTRNAEVTGNRLRNADGQRGKFPWIRINNCSGDIVVENNAAESFKLQRGVVSVRGRLPDYRETY